MAEKPHSDPDEFARLLRQLRLNRRSRRIERRIERARRSALTRRQRDQVFDRTSGRCHLCGGAIVRESSWQADHVLAHSANGPHSIENYLPAHSICNNYRLDYDPEEFQLVLKLGVRIRHEIETGTELGKDAGKLFCAYEDDRKARRKRPSGSDRAIDEEMIGELAGQAS